MDEYISEQANLRFESSTFLNELPNGNLEILKIIMRGELNSTNLDFQIIWVKLEKR